MASPNDNISLKDAVNPNAFKMRTKDVSSAQDGSIQYFRHLSTPYPIDYGIGGCYQLTSQSGLMAAGMSPLSPIYAFRVTSASLLAILRRLRITAYSQSVGFAAGLTVFNIVRATAWSVADSGGGVDTLTFDNGNMRTAMPGVAAVSEIRHSTTGALTPGTRTLDAQPIDGTVLASPVSSTTLICNRQTLFDKAGPADHPLVMTQNEGFIVQATVPGTGTWGFSITPEWDEVPVTSY